MEKNGTDADRMARWAAYLRDPEDRFGFPYIVLRESIKSFKRNNGLETSATLAFYGFFSLIPLFILVMYLTSNFLLSSQIATKAIGELAEKMFPAYHKVLIKEVYAVSRQRTWGLLSILALFWAVTPLAAALRSAFMRIFAEEQGAPYWKEKLINASAVFVMLLIFVGVVTGEILYDSLMKPYMRESTLAVRALNLLATPVLTAGFMALFYLLFCPVRLKVGNLLAGSLVTAVLWVATRPLFVLFLKFNPNYGVTFGSLKAIFILIIWVYYQFAVILFGTEIMANIRRREALLLAQLFRGKGAGRKGPTRVMERFARSLSRGEVICREGEEGQEMFYILWGSVDIRRADKTLRVMREGEYFGEMAMLLGSPRVATVVAAEDDTRVVRISRDNLEVILRENPKIVMSILREMAERVKKTNEMVDAIDREKANPG